MRVLRFACCCAAAALAASVAAAGPYSGPYGSSSVPNPYDEPIPGFVGPDGDGKCLTLGPSNVVNPLFTGWAAGYVDYEPTSDIIPGGGWDDPGRALGSVTGERADVVSLGELTAGAIASGAAPGQITLTFNRPIRNGLGADFAVFENGFIDTLTPAFYGKFFAELAYVEVSTNGLDFARFSCLSLTAQPTGYFAYGGIDSTDVYGLAGKHANAYGYSWGTPFDLDALVDDPLVSGGQVNLAVINYVRFVDVPGSGDFLDSDENAIYDAWPTWASGGFDLEAVGVIHSFIVGDMDASGAVDGYDITPFVMALTDRTRYEALYPGIDPDVAGDVDYDGALTGYDITPFVALLAGLPVVPEPACLALLAAGACLLPRRRR